MCGVVGWVDSGRDLTQERALAGRRPDGGGLRPLHLPTLTSPARAYMISR